MKILFYHPNWSDIRKGNLSYTTLEQGAGLSGTETALLEMCHYLVSKGHHIQVVGVNENYSDDGVTYFSDIERVDFDVDWYCPLCFVGFQNELTVSQCINPERTKLLLWFHCFITDEWVWHLNKWFTVYGQYVSTYVAKEYTQLIPSERSWTIGNGLNSIFTECTIPSAENKSGNWIFHASFSRGGVVACSIFQKVRTERPEVAKKMNMLSYYSPDILSIPSGNSIEFHGSKTKLVVRDMLLTSDYFVYPLVNEAADVHHDTFATVILEALACGCIVLVWDVACISNVYYDYVIKIPVPFAVQLTYAPFSREGTCPWMLSTEAQQLFVDAILQLETDSERKERIRTRGVEWARQFTWTRLAAQMEERLLVPVTVN